MASDGIAHREHSAQVCRTVFAGRSADSNEQHLTMFNRELFIAGKTQALAVEVVAHKV